MYSFRPTTKYFERLVISIIGQQLAVNAAKAINKRVNSYFDNKITPQKLQIVPEEALRELGVSFAKIKYIKDLSKRIIDKTITFNRIKSKSDEEIILSLTSVKGIGVWTSHMFLIFTLGRQNILPVGDLGIKKAIMLLYNLENLPDEAAVKKISIENHWAPYNSIAAWYLWRFLDLKLDFSKDKK